MPNPSTPHDAVFRRILGTPSNAASQLRATLPAALIARLDLDRLVLVPGSLIDATLRWRHTDLLFTVPLDGRAAFVYVLIEVRHEALVCSGGGERTPPLARRSGSAKLRAA
ncbi:Rpn family recombination-promoting nuclease/putative transposase [Frankia sp. CiP3]|uniref:Rpn family recombination-promoting nuclease/putative transposase n=1 Tax=Frankia sp. CiP3 TaxID=2880971 RepID=UPI001EF5EE75|nr:Rpn family recombination-promoting nuclease/putative transposase [Frankia sp. CiP3]